MIHKHIQYYSQHIKDDVPAGIVVFLVALPLCLGIALASGAPLFSGLISGLVGGLVVAFLSGSQLSVSGPAAGLTVIVLNAIESLGSFQGLLVAVVLAGVLQVIFGYLKAGIIGAFFPAAVIKGMLAAIGLILIIKQVPQAVGYDTSYQDAEDYLSEISFSWLNVFSVGAVIITSMSLLILIVWELPWFKKQPLLKLIPSPLVVVLSAVIYNVIAGQFAPDLVVSGKYLVSLPISEHPLDFFDHFSFPDFNYLANPKIYSIAVTLAIIASLETLLSLEAVDKLDPLKRIAPTNRELKAQGMGNILSGLLGGLPITAVIVRSAANVNAGGKTSLSCFVHGLCLLLSVLFFARYLNFIPLACLSAILLQTGYKLAKPSLFKSFYKKGMSQFLPFFITVLAILLSDLLIGIAIGMAVGLFFVIRANYQAAISFSQDKDSLHYTLSFNKDVSFLNKALLRDCILSIEENSTVTIDASNSQFIDHDILETINDFLATAPDDNIGVEVIDLYGKETVTKNHSWQLPRKKSKPNLGGKTAMQKLLEGVHYFQSHLFGTQRELFERLSHGQSPETLFITCSDSRINPNLLTQTEPGELFIMRNAGNIIPPYGAGHGGEAATIEFAVAGLGVKDIIVCGHSHCGAMKGLIEPPSSEDFPALNQWLSHAESTRRIVKQKYTHHTGESLFNVTVQENVLVQMENLRTHPTVAAALSQGKLKLHGWVYKIESGEVFGFDPENSQFCKLNAQKPPRSITEQRLVAVEI